MGATGGAVKPLPFEKGRGLVKRLKPLLKDKKGLGMLVKKMVSLLTKKYASLLAKKCRVPLQKRIYLFFKQNKTTKINIFY